MKKKRPAKRRILKNGILLDDKENDRFLIFANSKGFKHTVDAIIDSTGLYLRGRWDGPGRSGTEPCGYVFVSRDSFVKGHAPILFIDPMPDESPLNISFRSWKHILPFSEEEWDNLDGNDRLQEKMRILELTTAEKLKRAIGLAKTACQTFKQSFDLTIDLLKST